RRLDHDANRHIPRVLAPFGLKLPARLVKYLVGAAQVLQPGDHRVHDARIIAARCAQDGPKLGLEQFRAIEADADGTPAEERVQLVLKVDVGRRLVAADVERAHNNRALSEYLEDLAVDANLLVLRRGAGVLEVQELGAQQADAL